MATLATGGRITREILEGEIVRLKTGWNPGTTEGDHDVVLEPLLGSRALEKLDLFDRVQLAFVVGVCRESATLSDAGRKLFSVTREKRKTANDADRLRKYLNRFGLTWDECKRQ